MVVILATDVVVPRVTGHLGALGLVDELGHAATGLLVVLAVESAAPSGRVSLAPRLAIIAGALIIDVDHLPSEVLGWDGITVGTPRPWSHALWTPLALGVAAGASSRSDQARDVRLALAVGVLSHLVRDLAVPAGVGVSLLWPFSTRPVQISEVTYATGMCALALAGGVRVRSARRPPARRHEGLGTGQGRRI